MPIPVLNYLTHCQALCPFSLGSKQALLPVPAMQAAITSPALYKHRYTMGGIVDTGFLPSLRMTSQPTPWLLHPAPWEL